MLAAPEGRWMLAQDKRSAVLGTSWMLAAPEGRWMLAQDKRSAVLGKRPK